MASDKYRDQGEASNLVGYKGKKTYKTLISRCQTIVKTAHAIFVESSIADLPSEDQDETNNSKNPVLQHTSSTGQKPSAITQLEEGFDLMPAPQPRLEKMKTQQVQDKPGNE